MAFQVEEGRNEAEEGRKNSRNEVRNSNTTFKPVDPAVLDYTVLKTGDIRPVCHLKREN